MVVRRTRRFIRLIPRMGTPRACPTITELERPGLQCSARDHGAPNSTIYPTDVGNNEIFAVNPTSGDRTAVSGNGVGGVTFGGLTYGIADYPTVASVPEPSSVVLLGMGIDGLLPYQRRTADHRDRRDAQWRLGRRPEWVPIRWRASAGLPAGRARIARPFALDSLTFRSRTGCYLIPTKL